MKRILLTLTVTLLFATAFSQVAINTDGSQANASAMLDVKSNTAGLLIPRMTSTQRNAIASPAQGLLVYDTDDSTFYYYKNSAWVKVGRGASGWYTTGNYIYTLNDSVGIGTSSPQAPLEVRGRISQTGTGRSVFLGEEAGNNDDLNNNENVFAGYLSGYYNSSGYYNVAIGSRTLYSNTTGSNNVASGAFALVSNTTGSDNIASGYSALSSNTTGTENTATGSGSLNSNTTGYYNTAYGSFTLKSNTTGNSNSAHGSYALHLNTTGNYNVANGSFALYSNETGSHNIAIGYQAGYNNQTGTNNVFLGYQAGYSETGSNKLYIDNSNTTTPLIGGDFSANRVDINGTLKITGGSPGSGKILKSDASGNASWVDGATVNGGGWTINGNYIYNTSDSVGIGTSTPQAPLEVHGRISQTGTGYSVFLGEGAGKNDDLNSNDNVFIGYQSGYSDTTGYGNTAIGYQSLWDNKTGNYNVANGYEALFSNTTGWHNTASGTGALASNTTGYYNVAFGSNALILNVTGSNNVAIGTDALDSTNSSYNTALGYQAGYRNKTGTSNVFLGYQAGYYETGSYKLYIDNSSTATPLIGGDFLANRVDINGTLKITGGSPGAGKILTSDASGNASWVDGATVNGGGWTVNGNYVYNLNDSIGIGTTTPSCKLDVHGKISISETGESVYIGEETGKNDNLQHSYHNTGIGYNVLKNITNGQYNTALGWRSMVNNTSGQENTALGDDAMLNNTLGCQNVAVGNEALLKNTLASNNTALGNYALHENTNGYYNVAVGAYALDSTNANYNTAIGYHAGYCNQTGNNNIFIGAQAGYFETGSNKLYIDNSSSINPLIGGDFSADRVDINGTLKITGGSPGTGKILTSDASGNASWVNGATVNGGGWTVSGTTKIYNTTANVGIGTSDPNEPLEVINPSGGTGRMIVSDGGGSSRRVILFVSPTSSYQYSRIESYDYGGATGLPLYINNLGGGDIEMGGNCLPLTDKGEDLGSSSKVWNNIYYHNLVNSGAAAFNDRNVTEELLNNPPKPKPSGSHDEFTETGLKELDPNSVPKELRKGYALLTDEMTTYNYKANYEQQVQLEDLKKVVSDQNQTIEDLKQEIEQLKQMVTNKK